MTIPTFTINPCKACSDYYKDPVDNIDNINNCCSETTAAFLNTDSINSFSNTRIFQNNQKCIQDLVDKKSAVPPDTRRPANAPVFNQVPVFFPYLYKQSNDIEDAKNKCIKLCKRTSMVNECTRNCIIQSSCVDKITSPIPPLSCPNVPQAEGAGLSREKFISTPNYHTRKFREENSLRNLRVCLCIFIFLFLFYLTVGVIIL